MSDLIYLGPLVTVEWLIENINHPQLKILDASWHLPKMERSGHDEWLLKRIPNSGFFDYDGEIKDHSSNLPRMLPSPQLFTHSVQKLGINNDSFIVVYDTNNLFSSPRAWWMFRAMGHQKVAVLDGGLKAWEDAKQPLASGEFNFPEKGDFKAKLIQNTFIDSTIVLNSLASKETIICDARSSERFDAAHMPGASNIPYSKFINEGRMKPVNELKAILKQQLDEDQSMICTCGSGVTACILALGAELAGHKNISVYDGSWSEWGKGDFPILANS